MFRTCLALCLLFVALVGTGLVIHAQRIQDRNLIDCPEVSADYPTIESRFGLLATPMRIVTKTAQGINKGTVLLGSEDRLTSREASLRSYSFGRPVEIYRGPGVLDYQRVEGPLDTKSAMLVMGILPGSSAAASNLVPGDVIINWNGSVPDDLGQANLSSEVFAKTLTGKALLLASTPILIPTGETACARLLPGQEGGCFWRRFCPTGCYPCRTAESRFIGCFAFTCNPQETNCTLGSCCATCYLI